ncbi:MAG: hypothetical protein FWF84_03600 [Kiritimatiellaeota bacterium]|nr:hypothetical protein [Kiritimatiellota bacterium]
MRGMVALLLWPAVVGVAMALWHGIVFMRSGRTLFGLNADVAAFFVGLMLYAVTFAAVPRSSKLYVWGHELTHALFGLFCGASVGKIRVKRDSGSVMLSRTNVLILLAPYFFPFYAMLPILVIGVTACFVPLGGFRPWLVGLIGFAWGFHLCFTVSSLLQGQTDVSRCGRLFSYTLIVLLNLIVLSLGLVAIAPQELGALLRMAGGDTWHAYRFCCVTVMKWCRLLQACR